MNPLNSQEYGRKPDDGHQHPWRPLDLSTEHAPDLGAAAMGKVAYLVCDECGLVREAPVEGS